MESDPQPEDKDYGHLVEEEVRQIVVQLGVADFVYTVPVVRHGGGTREVGDALLFSNGMGAILQMKSRLPGSREENGPAWLTRRGGKAYRQGKGSRRKIALRQAEGSTVVAFPVRADHWAEEDRQAVALLLTMDVADWPVIVVLDHPNVDGLDPPFADAFWITTADWLELNRALRSVTAVLTYVRRVLDAGALTVPLGHEVDRFRAVVEADARYAEGGGPMSRPWLTADSLRDETGADLYRELLTGCGRQTRSDRMSPSPTFGGSWSFSMACHRECRRRSAGGLSRNGESCGPSPARLAPSCGAATAY